MRNAESHTALRAALLWDVPVLRTSNSPSAAAFLQVLELRELSEPVADETDPLGIAATGLAAELNDDTEQAEAAYRRLTKSTGLASALGWALLSWMQSPPPDALEGAKTAAEGIDEPPLRAHYYSKLTTFAFDRGERERAEQFFDLALRDAGDSPLGTALRFVGANYFGRELRFDAQLLHGPRDALVDLPWIHQGAEDNARQTLVQGVVDRAELPWRRTIRFGATVVYGAQAAELQATWAGALWMLRSLRLQLGAQLLTTASSPESTSLGVAMWILGEGSSLPSIIRTAESRFDNDSADTILNQHLARGRRLASFQRFLQAASAMWDLVSEETAAWLLTELKPSTSQDLDQEQLQSLWAVLTIRAPEVWAAQFVTLEHSVQAALLDHITPAAAAFVREDLVSTLLRLAEHRLLEGNASENVFLLYVSLLHRVRDMVADEKVLAILRGARPEVVVSLGRLDRDLIGIDAITHAAESLRRQVIAENDEARKGTGAVRTFDCRLRLGLALALLPSPPRHLTNVLIETAMDRAVSADYRLYALRGLAVMAQANVLDPALAKQLSQIPPPSEPSWFSNISGRLLETAVRAVTALASPGDDDDVALLNSSRDPDDRIRDLAVKTASHVIRRQKPTIGVESSILTIALFGALFDPVETVLLDALEAVPALFDERLREVLTERLEALFHSSESNVRTAVAQVAVQLSAKDTNSELSRIVDLARADRSWKVRNAVRNPDTDSPQPQSTRPPTD